MQASFLLELLVFSESLIRLKQSRHYAASPVISRSVVPKEKDNKKRRLLNLSVFFVVLLIGFVRSGATE